MKKAVIIIGLLLPMFAQAQDFKYQKTDNGYKHYQGQSTFTGVYSRNLDPEYLDYIGDAICFFPDQASEKKVPNFDPNVRNAWFCFSNFETAKKTFKLPDNIKKGYCSYEGKASITIKNYRSYIEESEGFDLTHLVSAKNISPVQAIKCNVS